jgi:SSS family solute:Na+ symporter
LNGAGAISSLLSGFMLGAVRFILELMDAAHGGSYFSNSLVVWLVKMNFLHYAILMFVICSLVLIVVSFMTAPPDRKKLVGLTFATVSEKMDISAVQADYKPPAETATEHRLNVIFSLALIATVIGLWIYFR